MSNKKDMYYIPIPLSIKSSLLFISKESIGALLENALIYGSYAKENYNNEIESDYSKIKESLKLCPFDDQRVEVIQNDIFNFISNKWKEKNNKSDTYSKNAKKGVDKQVEDIIKIGCMGDIELEELIQDYEKTLENLAKENGAMFSPINHAKKTIDYIVINEKQIEILKKQFEYAIENKLDVLDTQVLGKYPLQRI